MNIVQVGTFPYPSPQGSQVYVRGIVRGLAQMGHTVDLVCYGHGIGDTRIEEQMGVQIWRTPAIRGYQRMRAGPDIVKPLLDVLMALKLRNCQPDIIHVHNYEAPFVAWMAKWLYPHLRGIPVVYSAHNTMEDELPTYFSKPRIRRLSARFGRVLDQQIPKRHAHSIVLREQSVQQLKLLGCSHVSVVSPGIDPTEFLSVEELREIAPLEMSKGQWIVYAGNPDGYQDLHILMEALNRIPEVNFVFVSSSDATHWKRTDGRTLYIQTNDFSVVQAIIEAADLAVIPRMNCTGFPIKLLNYLALGTVSICADGSSISAPGVVVVPNGNIDAIVREVGVYLNNEGLRDRMGNLAKEYALNEFTWRAQAKKLTEIYQSLLD